MCEFLLVPHLERIVRKLADKFLFFHLFISYYLLCVDKQRLYNIVIKCQRNKKSYSNLQFPGICRYKILNITS